MSWRMPGFDRERVLALAALASSEADQDPIDAAIRAAAKAAGQRRGRTARALRSLRSGDQDIGGLRRRSRWTRASHHQGRIRGHCQGGGGAGGCAAPGRRSRRAGTSGHCRCRRSAADALRLVGLIALSDPPREDSAELIATLRDMGVRTVMVTGDSAVTAAAIARKVGITGAVCPPERLSEELSTDEFGVFARVVPEEKYRLVKALQSHGHVVGMCGDGTNDAPALRQAQIGIAVSSATDVAKAAAGMVMTEPGLAGIVFAVREGRIAFQRLLTYTFNMLVKKIEIVLFLAIGLVLTGHAVMTPALMVLLFMTNDFLSMSLTTDRASPAPSPSVWRMRNITAAAVVLGAVQARLLDVDLGVRKVPARAWRRESCRRWPSSRSCSEIRPCCTCCANGATCGAPSRAIGFWRRPLADIAIVSALALSGTLMEPLPWQRLGGDIRRCDRLRADPRSDQAAGHVGLQGRINRGIEHDPDSGTAASAPIVLVARRDDMVACRPRINPGDAGGGGVRKGRETGTDALQHVLRPTRSRQYRECYFPRHGHQWHL